MKVQNRQNIHKLHEQKILESNHYANLRFYYFTKTRALQSVI
jgi:hypothetical protein